MISLKTKNNLYIFELSIEIHNIFEKKSLKINLNGNQLENVDFKTVKLLSELIKVENTFTYQ